MIHAVVILTVLVAFGYSFYLYTFIRRQPDGNERMRYIAKAIRDGAMAFLRREYRILVIYSLIVGAVLWWLLDVRFAGAFLAGGLLSAVAGFIGMRVATLSNVRTAQAATVSLSHALDVSFSSGTIMGLVAVSLGLVGLYGIMAVHGFAHESAHYLHGFGLGCASIALFMRVGGGIYTKAADVGADIVGKVEHDFPEDDPRNPAVVADNVGDNVGDIAGMGADLYDSYVVTLLAAVTLAFEAPPFVGGEIAAWQYPIYVAAAGIISSLLASFTVRAKKEADVQGAIRRGLLVATVLSAVASYFLTRAMFPDLKVFWATLAGTLSGLLIGWSTEFFTSGSFRPVKRIATVSESGAATNVLEGFSVGLFSTLPPILIIGGAIYVSYETCGLYGTAIAGVGMLSMLGMALAVDAYGPVADNAGGIAEMANLGKAIRARTDALDAAGNTTAAIGKGFAIGSAGLTVLALLAAFCKEANLPTTDGHQVINVLKADVMIGLFIGGVLPFVFSSLCIRGVGSAAHDMIQEVRRQFREIEGLLEGKAEPDHARCIDISTTGALKAMIAPGLLVLISPVLVGYFMGFEALGGMLTGALLSGMLLAITMANAGGAWDNAKKNIEFTPGGKGSDPHKAAVVGDTVGDPFKDTAGPSINILIKMMSIIALICIALFGK